MHVGGVALGVRLKDVVHHRQAEAPHQLAVERQMAVVHAVAQTVEVSQDDVGLLVSEMDDGVVVERDAAPDAVVVRRQEVLEEFVVGGEPLHLQVCMCGQVLHAGGCRYHHKVVFHDMVTPVVEHETALARCAVQMHAGVAQLGGIHAVKVGGIQEINFHSAKIRKLSIATENFVQIVKTLKVFVKAMFGENSVILQSEFQIKLQTNYADNQIIKRSGDAVAGLRGVPRKP